ncbi:hypothetical protein ACXYTJ_11255 [Gilvimarinus sp. F26214L]|uniref:hypothetical protein n=1 Tax=Gilvimarinus sp. DZF01 TaxID=3461371 RepID=UPI004045D00F
MPKRKYLSEFGLNMVSGLKLLMQQADLGRVAEFEFSPHIYIVCRRPRITIDRATVKFTETRFSCTFKKQVQDRFEEIEVDVPNLLGTADVQMICEYPFTEYSVITPDKTVMAQGKSALLLSSLGPKYWPNLDLEVLYVGQAYGVEGSRNAADRLQKHETLQGIYAEAMRNSPDQEVWLLLAEFHPFLLASFDGRTKDYETSLEDDDKHIDRVLADEMTTQQRINFIEAALIKYFQPNYNKIYKDTFPNPAHKTYAECYDIDLNMVCVEVQMEDMGARLWSESASPAWVHFCSFPLHSREDRVYMFELDGKDGL